MNGTGDPRVASMGGTRHTTWETPAAGTTIFAYVAFGIGGTIMFAGFIYLVVWAFSSRNAPYRSYKWMHSVRQREELELMGRQGPRPSDVTGHGKPRSGPCQPGHDKEACLNCQRHSFDERERRYSLSVSKKRGFRSVFQESENSLRQKLGLDKFSLFDESRRNTMVDCEWNGASSAGPSPSPRRSSHLEPRGSCGIQDLLTVDYRCRQGRSPQRQRRKSSGAFRLRKPSPYSSHSDIDVETSFSEISDDVSHVSFCRDEPSSVTDTPYRQTGGHVTIGPVLPMLGADRAAECSVSEHPAILNSVTEERTITLAEPLDNCPLVLEVAPDSARQHETTEKTTPTDCQQLPDTSTDVLRCHGTPRPCLKGTAHGVRIHIEPSTPEMTMGDSVWPDGFV